MSYDFFSALINIEQYQYIFYSMGGLVCYFVLELMVLFDLILINTGIVHCVT